MDLGISGRHYYLTGISGAIGSALTQVLVAEGAVVHGCARSDEGLRRLAATLPAKAAALAQLDVVDVTDEVALAESVAEAGAVAGRLDGVVACAGAGVTGSTLGSANEVWLQQFSVKVLGVLNLVRPAVTWLERSDRPRIVILNGVTAHHPEPTMAVVSACRAAVANLGRSLAVDLAGRVGVVVANLGAVQSERQVARWQSLAPDQPYEDWLAGEVARRGILVGRLAEPDEVARVLAFLLSPLAEYVSGTSVDIAGGSRGRAS